jgi:hypothetical protein
VDVLFAPVQITPKTHKIKSTSPASTPAVSKLNPTIAPGFWYHGLPPDVALPDKFEDLGFKSFFDDALFIFNLPIIYLNNYYSN